LIGTGFSRLDRPRFRSQCGLYLSTTWYAVMPPTGDSSSLKTILWAESPDRDPSVPDSREEPHAASTNERMIKAAPQRMFEGRAIEEDIVRDRPD
jgi:hypothetical protein